MALTLNGSTGITSANIADGTITNADINASAAIDASKLTNLPAGGKVLQVVTSNYGTEKVSTSSSWADTGLSATITPSSASNKILVIVQQNGLEKRSNDIVLDVSLFRGSTEILSFVIAQGWTANGNPIRFGGAGCTKLDSPATTSAVTYKTRFKANPGGYSDVRVQGTSSRSTITLMEIAQ